MEYFENISAQERLNELVSEHKKWISAKNKPKTKHNGVYRRFENPVITRHHIPLEWRYDLNPVSNPFMMERMGINATFNAGAIFFNGKYVVIVRVEGTDRKSFFAIAESENGIDNFRFWEKPVVLPQTEVPDTNVYDMRLVEHEDGFIYGLFCTERKDTKLPNDTSAAVAQCGLARTKDLINWERLPDLKTSSGQQRNVVLHPEFIDNKYALYTRPQDGFISVGSGGGIGWGLCDDMANAEIKNEAVIDGKVYHTIKEVKNGQGPAPIKTSEGWLHLAHGVRNTAAGLRYVLYMFMTDLHEPWRVTFSPGGHFIAPESYERLGDVSNVTFANGWIGRDNGDVYIYYASSDTRLHVAYSTIDRLIDYCKNTPSDPLTSRGCVDQRIGLIEKNKSL